MFDISSLENNEHTFVIAEAGSNWKCGNFEDDLNQAKKLIDIAVDSSADAVKFQTFKAKSTYVKNAGEINYLKSKTKDIWKLFDELSMPYEMLNELSNYCVKKKIHFMSTPFSVEDAKQVDQYVELHKVASFEINHVGLLKYLSDCNKPIIISTGASSYSEIDFALNILKEQRASLALLQCTSRYPADFNSMNISAIPKIKDKYKLPIGLSDHSIDPLVAPLLAIGMGATIIEKHFTIDKTLEGPDHFFSLDPSELKIMVSAIRNADKSKGDGNKEILSEENELWKFAKRRVHAITDISSGDIFKEGTNIDLLRSGHQKLGAEPKFLSSISGKKSKRNIQTGEGVTVEDIE
tara:strand:+ start:1925 stop:2977 length:1053 start_codon:yes stop_codon:yes gene_type:complete